MLTTEQMNKLMADELNGKEQDIKGKDADKFLAGIRKDIAKAKKDGMTLDIPPEWPGFDEEE
jgi:hypothetical protein